MFAKPKRHYAHWKKSEDDKLKNAIARFFQDQEIDWNAVSDAVGKNVRACRARWHVHFCTVNQDEWSPEEDEILLGLCKEMRGKWVELAKMMSTLRSGLQCQQRYLLLQRRNEKSIRTDVLRGISEIALE
jgi:hypothetical protein